MLPEQEDEWTILAHCRMRMVEYSVCSVWRIRYKYWYLKNLKEEQLFDHLMRIADEELLNLKTKNPNLCK